MTKDESTGIDAVTIACAMLPHVTAERDRLRKAEGNSK